MDDDRQRVVVGHLRADQVHRHLRAGHVGDRHVGEAQPVGDARAPVERGQAADQPGRAEGGEVGRDDAAEGAHLLLHRRGAALDRLQPLGRIGLVGAEVDQGAGDLVVRGRVALLAQRDRHAGDQRLLRQLAAVLQVAAQRRAAQPQHHVVDRCAQALADRLDLGQRQRDGGEGALVGDRVVERRRRRELEGARRLLGLARGPVLGAFLAPLGDRLLHRAGDRLRQRRHQLQALDHLPRLVLQRRREQLGDAELVGVGADLARRLHRPRLGRDVEQAGRHRHPGLAVDGAVVHLAVEADPAVGQALDDVELPERPAAVEQHRMQPRRQRLELLERARLGQHHVAHVVVEVDVVVVDPDRVGEVERHQRELAGEHRRHVHALGDVRLHRLVVALAGVAGGRLEQVEAADVHRHLGAFHVQEGAVDDAQVFHLGHGVTPGGFPPCTALAGRRPAGLARPTGAVRSTMGRWTATMPSPRAAPKRGAPSTSGSARSA